MIKVTDLSKIFRTEEIETTALNGVSFEIKEGEFVAIMGPSGCGKSTLLNILGLLVNPSGGSYELMGQEVAKLKERDRTRFRKGNIGFVFQSFNLIDELNVFENVAFGLRLKKLPEETIRPKVLEMLETVGLPVEGIALVAGIDRILDMGRTTVNITGDATCTIVVDAWEKRRERKKMAANLAAK